MINRLSGLADEMGSFFRKVKEREIEHLEHVKEEPEREEQAVSSLSEKDTEQTISTDTLTPADMLYTLLHE